MNPTDIIANAIHAAECDCGRAGVVSESQAAVAAAVLTNLGIANNAVDALINAGYGHILTEDQLAEVVFVVLGSVADGA